LNPGGFVCLRQIAEFNLFVEMMAAVAAEPPQKRSVHARCTIQGDDESVSPKTRPAIHPDFVHDRIDDMGGCW
jgi:hypothetical protein